MECLDSKSLIKNLFGFLRACACNSLGGEARCTTRVLGLGSLASDWLPALAAAPAGALVRHMDLSEDF
jgi:hypothetical protein